MALDINFYTYCHNFSSATLKFYADDLLQWIETLRGLQMDFFSKIGRLPLLEYQIKRRFAFEYLFAIYAIYRSKGVKNKSRWLRKYWASADKNDSQWSYQLNSGIPKTIGTVGRRSKRLLHVWLTMIFGVEKLRGRR